MSSTTEESRRVVKGMYTAAMAGDTAGFMGALDENVVVYEPSFLSYGGVVRGHAEFQKLFGTIAGFLNIPSLRLDSLVADGDVVVAFLKVKTHETGQEVDIGERSVVRNGRIVEMKIYYHEGQTLFPRASRG